MCLRDAGRAERRAVDRAKDLVPVAVVLLLDDGEMMGKARGRAAVWSFISSSQYSVGTKVGAHAHDLAELDKCWPEILEDGAQFFRREAVDDVVTSQYRYHLTQPQRSIFCSQCLGAVRRASSHLPPYGFIYLTIMSA